MKVRIASVLMLLIVGCRTDKVVPDAPEAPLPPPEIKAFAPDSVLSYMPELGDGTQARRFPFGSANKPNTAFRLLEFLEKHYRGGGRYKTVFSYDESGKLSRFTKYDNQGLIFSKHSYRYDLSNALIEVVSEINKDAQSYGSETYFGLSSNELRTANTTSFEAYGNSESVLLRTDEVKIPFYVQKPGEIRTKLGFSPDGQQVRQDVLYRNGVDETIISSKIFKREKSGNVRFIHSNSISYDEVAYYTYDDKPNPFKTTGDVGFSMDLLPGDLANVFSQNNVLSMETFSKEGLRDSLFYVYDYRADGYPERMRIFIRGELLIEGEFVYNQ